MTTQRRDCSLTTAETGAQLAAQTLVESLELKRFASVKVTCKESKTYVDEQRSLKQSWWEIGTQSKGYKSIKKSALHQ